MAIVVIHHVTLRNDLAEDFRLIKEHHRCSDKTEVVRTAITEEARRIRTLMRAQEKESTA